MITITQTCDGCGAERALNTTQNSETDGWRTVTGLRHLCAECIKKALKDE